MAKLTRCVAEADADSARERKVLACNRKADIVFANAIGNRRLKSPPSCAGTVTSSLNHLADVSNELLRGEEDFALGQPDLTESMLQKAGLV